jgi:hypothetical protein
MIDHQHVQHFVAVRAANGGDDIAAIRAIRERFGLDLPSAKAVMLQATGSASTLDEHQRALAPSALQALDEFEADVRPDQPGSVASGQSDVRPLYARLLRRKGVETYADAEVDELRLLLTPALGVIKLRTIEHHPKGGYRVTLDLEWSKLDSFIHAVDAAGWMNCL